MDRGAEFCESRVETEENQRRGGHASPAEHAKGLMMPQTSEATDVDALGEIMLIQGTMQRQFLRILLRRLAADVSAFNVEMFLAELDLLRESLQAGAGKSALHNFASKEWERLSEMALDAIASTRAKTEAH
jgi:hypothetical protein